MSDDLKKVEVVNLTKEEMSDNVYNSTKLRKVKNKDFYNSKIKDAPLFVYVFSNSHKDWEFKDLYLHHEQESEGLPLGLSGVVSKDMKDRKVDMIYDISRSIDNALFLSLFNGIPKEVVRELYYFFHYSDELYNGYDVYDFLFTVFGNRSFCREVDLSGIDPLSYQDSNLSYEDSCVLHCILNYYSFLGNTLRFLSMWGRGLSLQAFLEQYFVRYSKRDDPRSELEVNSVVVIKENNYFPILVTIGGSRYCRPEVEEYIGYTNDGRAVTFMEKDILHIVMNDSQCIDHFSKK